MLVVLNNNEARPLIFQNDMANNQSRSQVNRIRRHSLISMLYDHLVYYPTPATISYLWGFGVLAGLCLTMQLVTGIILVMHYNASSNDAFASVAHLMTDVSSGWWFRYLHANGASMFFAMVYLHMGRGLYYGSFMTRSWLWISGVILFILLMGTAFMGYILPWGQMSLWGATVITKLVTVIPFVGDRLVEWVWGDFAISGVTLTRFFGLHYLLPFILFVVMMVHLYFLHDSGSNNPLGLPTRADCFKLPFYPFFYLKDFVGFFALLFVYLFFVHFMPNVLGHADNYIHANPMVTPAHIVPEWYFLPFYAILRAVPNKTLGAVAMIGSLLMHVYHATTVNFQRWLSDADYKRSLHYFPLSRLLFWAFVGNFFLLGYLGACPVEAPYIIVSQTAMLFYFAFFFICPVLYAIEIEFVSVVAQLDADADNIEDIN